jgi:CD2 antigen cytoplasmic tail-binding protein 2
MDIYEMTFEKISAQIRELEDKKAAGSSKSQSDVLDMYDDDFDLKEKGKLQGTFKTPASVSFKNEKNGEQSEAPVDENKIFWEYKVNQETEEILGPFSSEQMQQKVESGEFKQSVFVRKVIKNRCEQDDAKFYSSSRMDFDLYI